MQWIPLNKVKIHWRKQSITEGIISVKPGTNSGSFYERGVFWNKNGNTIEAFSYTFLKACNSIINLVGYQSLKNTLQPFGIRRKKHFNLTWSMRFSSFPFFSCAWDTNYQRWLIIHFHIISQINMTNCLTIKSPRKAISWSFWTFLKDSDININFK